MFRFAVLIWPLAIILVAIGLFQIKYSVQEIDRSIRVTEQKLQGLQDYHEVLKTEWEFKNKPAELERLAKKYLGMDADQGTLVTHLDGLPVREVTEEQAFTTLPWRSNLRSERIDELPSYIDPLADFTERALPTPDADPLSNLIDELGAVQ